jgi:hypothetical protein
MSNFLGPPATLKPSVSHDILPPVELHLHTIGGGNADTNNNSSSSSTPSTVTITTHSDMKLPSVSRQWVIAAYPKGSTINGITTIFINPFVCVDGDLNRW